MFKSLCPTEVATVCSYLSPASVLQLASTSKRMLALRTDNLVWYEQYITSFGGTEEARLTLVREFGWAWEYHFRRTFYLTVVRIQATKTEDVILKSRITQQKQQPWSKSPLAAVLLHHALERNVPFHVIKEVLTSTIDMRDKPFNEVAIRVLLGEKVEHLQQLLPPLVQAYTEVNVEMLSKLNVTEDDLFLLCSMVLLSDATIHSTPEELHQTLLDVAEMDYPIEWIAALQVVSESFYPALQSYSDAPSQPKRNVLGDWVRFEECEVLRNSTLGIWRPRYLFLKLTHFMILKRPDLKKHQEDSSMPSTPVTPQTKRVVVGASFKCPQPSNTCLSIQRRGRVLTISAGAGKELIGTKDSTKKGTLTGEEPFDESQVVLRLATVASAIQWHCCLLRTLSDQPTMYA